MSSHFNEFFPNIHKYCDIWPVSSHLLLRFYLFLPIIIFYRLSGFLVFAYFFAFYLINYVLLKSILSTIPLYLLSAFSSLDVIIFLFSLLWIYFNRNFGNMLSPRFIHTAYKIGQNRVTFPKIGKRNCDFLFADISV